MAAELRTQPAGRLARRGIVFRLIRDNPGITTRDLAERGQVSNVPAHLESLRAEGHGFEFLRGTDEQGHAIARVYLRKNAWEGLPDCACN